MSFHWARGQRLEGNRNELALAPQNGRQDYFETCLRGSCVYNGSIVYIPVKWIGSNAQTALIELDGQRLTIKLEDLFHTDKLDPVLTDLIQEQIMSSETVVHASGAQRSADVDHLRYDLIHPIFAETIAEVLAEGAAKYGDHNWEQGFDIGSLFNHLLAHAFKYLGGDRSEDHLGHMSCNIMFLVVESKMRYNNHLAHLRGPDCKLTPEMLAHIAKFNAERKAKKDAESETQQFRDRIFELISTGTLKESSGILEMAKLRDLYFPEYTREALAMKLNQMGISATPNHVTGIQLDNCCHARNVCCKEGNSEQVEIVDLLTKAMQEGILFLGEGSISTDELGAFLRKDFKYPDIAGALRAFNLVLSDNRIEGISDPRAKEGFPNEVPTLQECMKVISELYETKVFRKSIGTSVRLRAVSKEFNHRYPPKMLVEAFDALVTNINVTYDSSQQDYILKDFGINHNARSAISLTVQAPPTNDPIDSIRAKVLRLFLTGRLRYCAGARLNIEQFYTREFPPGTADQSLLAQAFILFGFTSDKGHFVNLEWKGSK